MKKIENSERIEETLTREFFMQNTGVYQTHSNFELIKLEFVENKLTPEEFCKQWLKENPIFTVNLSGQIKIDASDDAMEPTALFNPDNDDITAIDMIESLSESEFYWKSKCEALYEGYKEAVDALNKSQSLLEEMRASNQDLLASAKDLCTCIVDNGKKGKIGYYGLPQ